MDRERSRGRVSRILSADLECAVDRRREPLIWFWVDLAAFLVSRAGHVVARAASRIRRRRLVRRQLRRLPEVEGAVMVLRPIIAPLSREAVGACRLIVERALADGAWVVVFDETQLGELEVRHRSGQVRLEGTAVLVKPDGTRFGGREVHAALGQTLAAEEQDLRATEYLLRHGEAVHVFGVAVLDLGAAGPYRAPPPSVTRSSGEAAVVLSAWPRRRFLRELRRRPHLSPPG